MLNALKQVTLPVSFLNGEVSDREILDMITGTTIDFGYLQVQHGPPAIREFSDTESKIIETEIEKQRCDCQN